MAIIRQEERKVPGVRIGVVQVAVVVGFVLLAGTFWFFQIIQHERFREMAENNHQRELVLRAPRGVLYDRNGKVIVEKSGQGRARRPEIRTTRAASQRFARLTMVDKTAAAGGTATTNKSMILASRRMRA